VDFRRRKEPAILVLSLHLKLDQNWNQSRKVGGACKRSAAPNTRLRTRPSKKTQTHFVDEDPIILLLVFEPCNIKSCFQSSGPLPAYLSLAIFFFAE
jgi:hypothetical protein